MQFISLGWLLFLVYCERKFSALQLKVVFFLGEHNDSVPVLNSLLQCTEFPFFLVVYKHFFLRSFHCCRYKVNGSCNPPTPPVPASKEKSARGFWLFDAKASGSVLPPPQCSFFVTGLKRKLIIL